MRFRPVDRKKRIRRLFYRDTRLCFVVNIVRKRRDHGRLFRRRAKCPECMYVSHFYSVLQRTHYTVFREDLQAEHLIPVKLPYQGFSRDLIYSTVTDFARLRGLSTSRPRATLV